MSLVKSDIAREHILKAAEELSCARDAEQPVNPELATNLNTCVIALYALTLQTEES